MSVEGHIVIDLSTEQPPRVQFEKPVDIARLLVGKTRQDVVALMPVIYSVCRLAQTCAAATALDGALDRLPDRDVDLRRQTLVAMESLREHVLRILLDWPGFSGDVPTAHLAAPVMPLPEQLKTALFVGDPFSEKTSLTPGNIEALRLIDEADAFLKTRVFGCAPAQWLGLQGYDGLQDWSRSTSTAAAVFLNVLMTCEDTECAPADEVEDTTPFGRLSGDMLIGSLDQAGLLARHTARLVALANLTSQMRRLLAGDGVETWVSVVNKGKTRQAEADIMTARGLLRHRVEMDAGRVTAYAIQSPTSVHFADDGLASRCLSRLASETLEKQEWLTKLVVNAIDPCVGFEVRRI